MKPSTILLTGASSGIGRDTATALIAAGHQVWGTARDAARLDGIAGLRPLALDLLSNDSIDNAMARGLNESGGFDVVINNAGNGIWGPLESLTASEELEQYQVLVFGPLRIIRAMLPGMRERNRGLVVNVTSLAASFAVPFLGTYSACKAALASSTWSLQMELRGTPVRVVDVRPGDINTEFHEAMASAGASAGAGADDPVFDAVYGENRRRAFAVYDRGMRCAPPPERVAQLIVDIVAHRGLGYTAPAVGNLFQARIAPFLARFAPAAWVRWCTGRYYNLR